MKEIKILNMFPDLLDLYSDFGNIEILKYRLEKRNMKAVIDTYLIGDLFPTLLDYDLIFLGGGSLKNQESICNDLLKYKKDLQEAIKQGVYFLLIDSSYQLFGKINDNKITNCKGLNLLPYETNILDQKPIIGNVSLDVFLNGSPTKVYGFENHISEIVNNDSPLGTVLEGIGNNSNALTEGYFSNNILASFLHGPLLALNPELSDYIIKYCLEKKYNEEILLDDLDDFFEENARKQKTELLNI